MAALIVLTCRTRVLDGLRSAVADKASAFLAEMGMPNLRGTTGFGEQPSETAADIAAAYAEARAGDRERGFTRFGVHRGDWSLTFAAAPRREHLSRGQEKLAALVMMLAQVEHFRQCTGSWPILLLDDLASELDADHLRRVLDWVFDSGVQAWMTGTQIPDALRARPEAWSLFHVEQGRITPA